MLKHQTSTGKQSVSDTIANAHSPHTLSEKYLFKEDIFTLVWI